jgi:Mn-dependent DtxR family transcriptional regulator
MVKTVRRVVLVRMTDFSDEERRILEFLRDSVAGGERYFRAKNIAKHLGLSSKQVGSRLPKLAEKSEDVDIEKWGRARSTTWKVSPN